jgi:hypothetical protein
VAVVAELAVGLVHRLEQRGLGLTVGRRAPAALAGVEALVGEAHRLAGIARLVGQRDRPVGGHDREALALLRERPQSRLDGRLDRGARAIQQEAELVAAHAVGRAPVIVGRLLEAT